MQHPLATVVIGGLVVGTTLNLRRVAAPHSFADGPFRQRPGRPVPREPFEVATERVQAESDHPKVRGAAVDICGVSARHAEGVESSCGSREASSVMYSCHAR